MKFPAVLVALPIAALSLAGCSAPATVDTGISVVASTDVYGDIAASIGGDLVTVTSLIDAAGQDPHSFEASARDRLAVDRADLVIDNGGGYDDFMTALAESSDAETITVVELLGVSGNEHVWYDLEGVGTLARELAKRFAELDPHNTAVYDENYTAFAAQLDAVESRVDAIADGHRGTAVALTEPVPGYLLEHAGLVNETPEAFSEAIEEGTDVSPLVLRETVDLVASGDVALLAYNEQTSGSETEAVRSAAESAGVPVVNFTETLPDGEDYVSWMTANVGAIEKALSE